jgi:hypothetical protein
MYAKFTIKLGQNKEKFYNVYIHYANHNHLSL